MNCVRFVLQCVRGGNMRELKNKTFTIRITEKTLQEIEKTAEELQVSKNEAINRLIKEGQNERTRRNS